MKKIWGVCIYQVHRLVHRIVFDVVLALELVEVRTSKPSRHAENGCLIWEGQLLLRNRNHYHQGKQEQQEATDDENEGSGLRCNCLMRFLVWRIADKTREMIISKVTRCWPRALTPLFGMPKQAQVFSFTQISLCCSCLYVFLRSRKSWASWQGPTLPRNPRQVQFFLALRRIQTGHRNTRLSNSNSFP